MPYVIEVTVKSQKGKCALGHKVGDKIVFDGRSVRGDICYSALVVLLPKIYAMRYGVEFPWSEDGYGVEFPWSEDGDTIFNACPDPENPVVFEIRRIRK